MEHFLDVARSVPADAWTRPRAPGKWSPAQVAEHVAVTMDQAVLVMEGRGATMHVPRFLRPLVRRLAFQPVLRSGCFPRGGKSPRGFEPSAGGVAQADAPRRLAASLEVFERTVAHHARDHSAAFEHPVFGRLSYADYVRFNALHAAHHERQLRPADG